MTHCFHRFPGLTSLLLVLVLLAGSLAVGKELNTHSTDEATTSPRLTKNSLAEQEAAIRQDIEFLAADALEGRDTGSEGIREAAEYIQKQFAAAGLTRPASLPEGLQKFSIATLPTLGKENSLQRNTARGETEWKLDEDFVVCSFGGSGKFSAPIVFCGYGIADPEQNFDEFAGVSLKGKIALMIRRVPGQNRPGSLYVSPKGSIDIDKAALRTKLVNARERGAVAAIFVNDSFSTQKDPDKLFEFGYGGASTGKDIPALQITQRRASELLNIGLGLSLAEVEQQIEANMQPASAKLEGVSLTGQADLDFSQTIGMNVIGVMEPANGEATETIVVGAHYDHVGWGKYGSMSPGTEAIHNGADDNASGTTALMALARELKTHADQFSRRVVLICFAAEERGLLGSKHYVSEPIYPLSETVAMINLDMVGRMSDEKLTVFGVGSSDVWNPVLDELEQITGLNFFREQKAFGPSDHAPFYEKQIPVIHLFTGLHEDYHRPTDDVDEINVQGIRRVVQVLSRFVETLATASERPNYIENKNWIQVGNHAGGRAHVGLIPDLTHTEPGLLLLEVEQNSPAAHAGLEAGDRLLQAQGLSIRDRADFWQVVDELKPKDKIQIVFERGDQHLTSELTLGKPR